MRKKLLMLVLALVAAAGAAASRPADAQVGCSYVCTGPAPDCCIYCCKGFACNPPLCE